MNKREICYKVKRMREEYMIKQMLPLLQILSDFLNFIVAFLCGKIRISFINGDFHLKTC
jgi:hypothetical protein